MSKRLLTIGMLAVMTTPLHAQEDAEAKKVAPEKTAPAAQVSKHEPVGYFLGISVGQQMRKNGFRQEDFDLQAVLAGFSDGLNDKDSELSDDQLKETQTKIQTLLTKRQAVMAEKQKVEFEKRSKKLKAAGVAFLAKNAKEEGIELLEGGIQYKVLAAGEGDSPQLTDTVQVHYTGKLIDGKVFDSSVDRGEPATFRVSQVIAGWQTALQKMKTGAKWMIYIPSDLAYGAKGAGGDIGPHQVLIFEVELLKIQ